VLGRSRLNSSPNPSLGSLISNSDSESQVIYIAFRVELSLLNLRIESTRVSPSLLLLKAIFSRNGQPIPVGLSNYLIYPLGFQISFFSTFLRLPTIALFLSQEKDIILNLRIPESRNPCANL